MTKGTAVEITELLQAWRQGDPRALDRLTPTIYGELYKAARTSMRRERAGHTLQTTALINELFLRISDLKKVDWQSRVHFLAICARQMRRILTDSARTRQAEKRGGTACFVSLEDAPQVGAVQSVDALLLDTALEKLCEVDERKCRVVELRFFGGLSVEESAEVLAVSPETIARDWRLARAWLFRYMGSDGDES